MPLPDDAKILSVDDHVVERPNVWRDRLPARYREAGPRIVEATGHSVDVNGHEFDGTFQVWRFEGRDYPTIGLNAVAGKPKSEIGLDPVTFDEMRPGCYEIKARLEDMDEDGIHAQLCFPSFPGFAGSTFFRADDKALATECVKAWNDFILDEWCAEAPDRIIPMGLVPYWDTHATIPRSNGSPRKGLGRSPSRRHRTPSGFPASTAFTGTVCTVPCRTPTWSCACTSAAAAPR